MLEDMSCFVSWNYPRTCQQNGSCIYKNYMLGGHQNGKGLLEDEREEGVVLKCSKQSDLRRFGVALTLGMSSPGNESSDGNQAGDNSDSSSLIDSIGRDNSISCQIHCSRSDYGAISSLNKSFRSLVQSGELYRWRREKGVVEHWVYFSCQLREWEAFHPLCHRWMRLPTMHTNDCFVLSDKKVFSCWH